MSRSKSASKLMFEGATRFQAENVALRKEIKELQAKHDSAISGLSADHLVAHNAKITTYEPFGDECSQPLNWPTTFVDWHDYEKLRKEAATLLARLEALKP